MNRFHDYLKGWHDRTKGWRIYAAALVLALPDILDALAGVDVSAILPDWMPGAKFSVWLALARIFISSYVKRLPPAALTSQGSN